MGAGREEFLARLAADLPDVVAGLGLYSAGLLHCEVADFRRATEQAMDAGRLWEAERHFQLVEELLAVAGPELRNALEVSYLSEDRPKVVGRCSWFVAVPLAGSPPARTRKRGHRSAAMNQ